jgi:hypothetical protein
MKDGDSERQKNNQKKQKKEDTGQDNIGKYAFHDMIHERIHDIVVKPFTNLLFSYVLDDAIDEGGCQSALSGRFFRHF